MSFITGTISSLGSVLYNSGASVVNNVGYYTGLWGSSEEGQQNIVVLQQQPQPIQQQFEGKAFVPNNNLNQPLLVGQPPALPESDCSCQGCPDCYCLCECARCIGDVAGPVIHGLGNICGAIL
jgi:hypothetical protein